MNWGPAEILIIAVVVVGAGLDLRYRRIPNWLTLGAALIGFAFAGVTGGIGALGMALLGWFVGVAVLGVFFLLRAMGAGDVKLLGAVGAIGGPLFAVNAFLFGALAGGILALAYATSRGRLSETMTGTYVQLQGLMAARRAVPVGLEQGSALSIPYGLAIAIGAIVTLFVRLV